MIFVSYYQKSIDSESFEKALDFYLDYCKTNNIEPELTEDQWLDIGDVSELDEAVVSHVLYHAEMNDFPVDEHME